MSPLSVAGGGRYDKLIGSFIKTDIPAEGIAFGFDRIVDILEELSLIPQSVKNASANVLVVIFQQDLLSNSIELLGTLRKNNIRSEMYCDPHAKLDKQLKYAVHKGIPFVAIIGPDEAKNNTVTVKDLQKRTQQTLPVHEAVKILLSLTQ